MDWLQLQHLCLDMNSWTQTRWRTPVRDNYLGLQKKTYASFSVSQRMNTNYELELEAHDQCWEYSPLYNVPRVFTFKRSVYYTFTLCWKEIMSFTFFQWGLRVIFSYVRLRSSIFLLLLLSLLLIYSFFMYGIGCQNFPKTKISLNPTCLMGPKTFILCYMILKYSLSYQFALNLFSLRSVRPRGHFTIMHKQVSCISNLSKRSLVQLSISKQQEVVRHSVSAKGNLGNWTLLKGLLKWPPCAQNVSDLHLLLFTTLVYPKD